MAQLIKMFDYISRYEVNPFHYPTQFIQLKRENWRKLNEVWESQMQSMDYQLEASSNNKSDNKHWFNFFSKNKADVEVDEIVSSKPDLLPQTETALRYYFLDELFNFQIKWATSTISQVSFTEQSI